MKNFLFFYYFFSIFFFCSEFFVLSHAGIYIDSDEIPGNRVIFLNQKHLESILKLESIQVKGASISEVIGQLTVLLPKDRSSVQKHQALQELNLYGSRIKAEGLKDLVGFIQEHFPNIKSLNLSWNAIGAVGAVHLAELPQLQKLDLTGNNIGDEGVAYLRALVEVKELDLSMNNIRDQGVAHLAGLTQLTELNLSFNKIGPKSVAYLAQLTQLKRLALYGNRIHGKWFHALSRVLGDSVSIFN